MIDTSKYTRCENCGGETQKKRERKNKKKPTTTEPFLFWFVCFVWKQISFRGPPKSTFTIFIMQWTIGMLPRIIHVRVVVALVCICIFACAFVLFSSWKLPTILWVLCWCSCIMPLKFSTCLLFVFILHLLNIFNLV